jgi:hypothetical protein
MTELADQLKVSGMRCRRRPLPNMPLQQSVGRRRPPAAERLTVRRTYTSHSQRDIIRACGDDSGHSRCFALCSCRLISPWLDRLAVGTMPVAEDRRTRVATTEIHVPATITESASSEGLSTLGRSSTSRGRAAPQNFHGRRAAPAVVLSKNIYGLRR